MEKFFKFTYRAGKPVRDYGKVVLLDRHRTWTGLAEGFEYIIENPVLLELEKCIIIKSAKFVLVDDIKPTYEVTGGPYVYAEENQIKFSVSKKVIYQEEVISSETDYENFTFGLTGNEEFYNLLPVEAKQQVDDFRVWMTWISENQLSVLSGSSDFSAHRGYRLQTNTESLKVETSGSGQSENPKEVYVLKLQTLGYQPVYQEGYELAEVEGMKEVVKTLARLSLDESGLPFSFRPIWKSPTMMVGILTVNGKEIEGLVKRPGDGTGSYLDAVMYLGLMEMPSATLADEDLSWLDRGGRICWVYEFGYELNNVLTGAQTQTTQPSDLSGWVKIKAIYGGQIRYIQDSFDNPDYMKFIYSSRIATAQKNLVPNFNNQISSAVSVLSEYPFYSGWSMTELGQSLWNRFETLKAEMIEGLTLENSAERVEVVRTKAEEIKTKLLTQHENAQALIVRVEEGFEKTLTEVEQEFVRTEADEIRNHIYQANNALQRAEFAELEHHCREAETMIASLQSLAETRRQERYELVKANNVPEYLLDAFRGNLDRTLEFMQNVATVETWRLDAHELSCGRSRSRAICENAWSAMGNESDFFCGADPNDVKYYVYEYHFGEKATPVGRKQEKGSFNNNLSASNDTMAEALRRAGLIK